jgi:hypothetical protein
LLNLKKLMAQGNMRKDAKEQLKYQEELQKYENDLKMVEYTINKLNLKKQELLIQIHNLKKQQNGSITIYQ